MNRSGNWLSIHRKGKEMNNEFGKMIEEKIQEIVAERMGNNEAIIKTMLPPQHVIDTLHAPYVIFQLTNEDMTWINMVTALRQVQGGPEVQCEVCEWVGSMSEVLTAPNPFEEGSYVEGCPNCKMVDTIRNINQKEPHTL